MSEKAAAGSHWAGHRERGSFALMKLTAWAVRLLGRRAMAPLLYLIVLYFYLFNRSARRSAWRYQRNLADWSGRPDLAPSWRSVYRQFMVFADALLDKLPRCVCGATDHRTPEHSPLSSHWIKCDALLGTLLSALHLRRGAA